MAVVSEIAQAYRDIGAARAGGAERAGQIYGSLAQYLGNVPNEVIAQRRQQQAQDQEQQLRAQQLQMGGISIQEKQRQMAAEDALGKAMSTALNPDGSLNESLLQQAVVSNPATAAQWPKIQEGLLATREKSAQVQKLVDEHAASEREHMAALANATDATDDPEGKASILLTGFAQGVHDRTIDPIHARDNVADFLGDDGNPDPAKVTAKIAAMKLASATDVEKRAQAAKAAVETKKAGLETQGLRATQDFQAANGGLTPEQVALRDARVATDAREKANQEATRVQEGQRIDLEKQRVDLERKRLTLSGGTGADPEAVAGYVRQVVAGDLPLQSVPARERDAVVKALASSGQNISKLTSQGKQMKETATTLLPLIDKVQSLATQLDQKGLLGTLGGRARNMAAVESAAANIQNLTPADRKLIGEFASAGGLLITGIARAHGGARAGGSSQMVAHLSKLMDAGNKDLPTFLGNLEGERDFMRAYSSMGEAAPAAAPTSGVKVLSIVPVK